MPLLPFGGATNVLCLMRQNFVNLRNQIGFRHRNLRHTRLTPCGIVLDLAGKPLAFDQILI